MTNFVSACSEHRAEPQIFKTKFIGWDDVIAVDYTRTAESVIRRGADMKASWTPFRTIASLVKIMHKS